MSPEEDRTRNAVDSEPKHYQLSYSGPLDRDEIMYTAATCWSVETQAKFYSRDEKHACFIFIYQENRNVAVLFSRDRFHMDPSGTFIQYDAKAIGSGSEGAQQALQEQYHKVCCVLVLWLYSCSLYLTSKLWCLTAEAEASFKQTFPVSNFCCKFCSTLRMVIALGYS